MCTRQSQDACALSRHYKPCTRKAPGIGLGTLRRTGLSSQQVVWAPEVPPGPLLFQEKKALTLHPSKWQVPFTTGWTGGAGRRKMELKGKLTGKLPEWGFELKTSGSELRTPHNHYDTHTHSHTHTQPHTHTHSHPHTQQETYDTV